VLFSIHTDAGAQIAVASLDDGTHRLLGLPGSDARYIAPGTLLFARDDAMFEAPFDVNRLQVTGPEVPVLPDAHVFASGRGISIALVDVDLAGNVVYLPGLSSQGRRLSWMDTAGHETPLELEPALYSVPRISPDGRRFVVGVEAGSGVSRIRVVDIARGLPLDLDTNGSDPVWAPDGTITFVEERDLLEAQFRGRVSRVPADDSAPPSLLLESADSILTPEDWAPDGNRLLFSSLVRGQSRGSLDRDLSVLVPGSDPAPLLSSGADEFGGRISPDGRWLAYQSTTSGRTRVYVRPFDAPGGTQTVSGEGGSNPVWGRDGRALYFIENGMMMRAAVETSPFGVASARAMFGLPSSALGFDVAADGRFLVVSDSSLRGADELRVVLGWKR
jgi:Tol biopolymer transport system component